MKGWSGRIAAAAAGVAAASIVTVIAVWFLGDALFLQLESCGFGAPAAALIVGLAGLALAVLIGLVARWLARARVAATPPASGNGVNDAAAALGTLVSRQIVASAKARPLATAGAALLAGLAVGAIPELRSLLKDALKE
jgi:hypothetical protein